MYIIANFSLFSYSKLAITANRKSIDEHIVLLNWSPGDDESAVSVVDIDRETFLPRIGLQGMQSRSLYCICAFSYCYAFDISKNVILFFQKMETTT